MTLIEAMAKARLESKRENVGSGPRWSELDEVDVRCEVADMSAALLALAEAEYPRSVVRPGVEATETILDDMFDEALVAAFRAMLTAIAEQK